MICILLINAEEVDENYEEYDENYPAYYDEDYDYDEEYNEEEEASGSTSNSEDEYPDYSYSYQVSHAFNPLCFFINVNFFLRIIKTSMSPKLRLFRRWKVYRNRLQLLRVEQLDFPVLPVYFHIQCVPTSFRWKTFSENLNFFLFSFKNVVKLKG